MCMYLMIILKDVFVLINMDKYKQGDQISGNGPLVQEITRDGVVIDYGDGQALLPPKINTANYLKKH